MFSGSGAASRSSGSCSSIVSGIGVPPWWRPAAGLVSLRLQVAVNEVDLLQSAQVLADLLGPALPHALDRLPLGVRRGQHLVEPAERLHDVGHDEPRQARDAPEYAEAAG